MSGSVLAVISDTHIGSTTALAPLRYQLHNRNSLELQTVEANRLQKWLHEQWVDYWAYVRTLSKRRRLIVAHLGDVIDGNHHGSTQLVSEVGDQYEMAMQLLEPIRGFANTFVGIFGTGPSHGGMDNADEAAIYSKLGADYVGQQVTLSIDGVLVDLAHHGRASARNYSSTAVSQAAEVMLEYAQSGDPLPNLILRGHRHKFQDSGAHFEQTRLIQCPAWQLKTSHGWKVATNARSDIGGVIVIDGNVNLSKARYRGAPDERKVVEC
ncbi:MAG: hypothetical protein VB108_01095 [Anaerolineaceae bacterium]|nr:hypothetical protein [Anaerolineaceae bacterium]